MNRNKIVSMIEERQMSGRQPEEAVGEYLWLLGLKDDLLSRQTVAEAEAVAADWLRPQSIDEAQAEARWVLARDYRTLLTEAVDVSLEGNPLGATTHPQLDEAVQRWGRRHG